MELFNGYEIRKMMSLLKAEYHRSSHTEWGRETLRVDLGDYSVAYSLESGLLYGFFKGDLIEELDHERERNWICTLLADEVLHRFYEGEDFISYNDLGWSTDMVIEHHNKVMARLA